MACGPEEAQQLAGHVSYLTDTVSELLASEERLIRTNAPAVSASISEIVSQIVFLIVFQCR